MIKMNDWQRTHTHTGQNSLSSLGKHGSKQRRLKSRPLATLMHDAYTPKSCTMLYNLQCQFTYIISYHPHKNQVERSGIIILILQMRKLSFQVTSLWLVLLGIWVPGRRLSYIIISRGNSYTTPWVSVHLCASTPQFPQVWHWYHFQWKIRLK